MESEQRWQLPAEIYWLELQVQLVGELRVNVFWQSVQLVLEVQLKQFKIAEAHDIQAAPLLYYVFKQVVQLVPLVPSLQRVQKEEFVHWLQFVIAAEQSKQFEPFR